MYCAIKYTIFTESYGVDACLATANRANSHATLSSMSLQNQNDVGTILYVPHGEEVIFSFANIGGKFRGGIFWCLPNQGPALDPFMLQNGEYRTLEGRGAKLLQGPWGSIQASVMWEFEEKAIHTSATLVSEHTPTYIRPGLHPYFAVGESFVLTIEEIYVDKGDVVNNSILYIEAPGKKATLQTGNQTIEISFAVETPLEYTPFFCVWTDNKERYLCIEPVLGKGKNEQGDPLPIVLQKGDSLAFSATISF